MSAGSMLLGHTPIVVRLDTSMSLQAQHCLQLPLTVRTIASIISLTFLQIPQTRQEILPSGRALQQRGQLRAAVHRR